MAPERNICSTMTEQNFTTIAERLGGRAGDLVDATEDAMRLEDHHTWPKRNVGRLGGLMRTKKNMGTHRAPLHGVGFRPRMPSPARQLRRLHHCGCGDVGGMRSPAAVKAAATAASHARRQPTRLSPASLCGPSHRWIRVMNNYQSASNCGARPESRAPRPHCTERTLDYRFLHMRKPSLVPFASCATE